MADLFTTSTSELVTLTRGVRKVLFSAQYQEILHSYPGEVLDSMDREVNPLPRPPLLEGADDGALFARLVAVINRYGYRVEVVDAPDVDPFANGGTWHQPAGRADQRHPFPAAAGQDGRTRAGPRRGVCTRPGTAPAQTGP